MENLSLNYRFDPFLPGRGNELRFRYYSVLAVRFRILLEAEINGVTVPFFIYHYKPPIILVWLKYSWKGHVDPSFFNFAMDGK